MQAAQWPSACALIHKCNRHGPRPVQPPYPMFPSWKPLVHFMCPTPRHSTPIQVVYQSNNPLPTSCSPRPAPSRPSQSWFRRHRKCDWISHRRVGPANEAYACFLPARLHAEGSGSSKHGGGGSEKHRRRDSARSPDPRLAAVMLVPHLHFVLRAVVV